MHTPTLDRIEQEHELREALDRDQFVLRYQPIIELASGQPVGVEALVRWQHPTRGLLPPSEFIPRAESTGLIVALGRSILDKACAQAARWRGDTELRLGVNLSARQLTDPACSTTSSRRSRRPSCRLIGWCLRSPRRRC